MLARTGGPDISLHATTVIAVRTPGQVAVASDGQVTQGDTIIKASAVKIRTMAGGKILAGFAGGVADALTLFDRFENALERTPDLRPAAVALARDWRSDRYLRRLEAQLLLADLENLLVVSGDGEVIEPDHNVVSIGSGGPYALAAARALLDHTDLDAEHVARAAMRIAASICIYTNDHIVLERVDAGPSLEQGAPRV